MTIKPVVGTASTKTKSGFTWHEMVHQAMSHGHRSGKLVIDRQEIRHLIKELQPGSRTSRASLCPTEILEAAQGIVYGDNIWGLAYDCDANEL